jgi:hypothetical protein
MVGKGACQQLTKSWDGVGSIDTSFLWLKFEKKVGLSHLSGSVRISPLDQLKIIQPMQ